MRLKKMLHGYMQISENPLVSNIRRRAHRKQMPPNQFYPFFKFPYKVIGIAIYALRIQLRKIGN